MTYEMIRTELDAINTRIASLKSPHFPDYGELDEERFLADYAKYDEAMRAITREAKAKGFIRIFNGRYKLNAAQAAL